MNQASSQKAFATSWRRWSAVVALFLGLTQAATARKTLERGVNKSQNQFTRELPIYDYHPSLAYKDSLKERKSSKSKGGKSKKKKCKGKKSKSKGKKSKGDCNEYWSPSEDGGYESTNERPWSPVSHAYPEYPSPSPYYGDHPEPTSHPVALSQDDSPTEWTPSAPYWYYSPSSPVAEDLPTVGTEEDPTSKPTTSPTTDSPAKDPTSPTDSPTEKPTDKPTDSPTPAPVEQSEPQPVQITITVPTVAPSEVPQVKPVEMTTTVPSVVPSEAPQVKPVEMTITAPTVVPSEPSQGKPVEMATTVPTIPPSKGPEPTFAPYEVAGSDVSPSSPSAWWSPVWFPSEFLPETASWKTEPIQNGDERGAMSTCETHPPSNTTYILDFTYEMFLAFATNSPETIASKIENVLHHELATRLLVCDFDADTRNVDDFAFTTVTSLPKDTLTNNECSGNVTIDGTECYEVLGRITVSVLDSEQSLADLIDGMEVVMKELMHGAQSRKRELQESSLLSADAAIQGLFFTGFVTNDATPGDSTQPGSSQAEASASSSRTVVGAVSLAAAAVIVVLGGLLVFRRRQSTRAYLDMDSDFNSRIGIQDRADSSSNDHKPIVENITDDASDFDLLSVYTNTGNGTSEDMTSLPDVSGADMATIGITPKRGPSETSPRHIPIISPELAKTQEIARLPDEPSISVAQASEDENSFSHTVDV